jgi:hypothetical protein
MRTHPSSSYFFQSFPTLEHFDIFFSEGAFWIYLVGWVGLVYIGRPETATISFTILSIYRSL